jgi:hypothetical protein
MQLFVSYLYWISNFEKNTKISSTRKIRHRSLCLNVRDPAEYKEGQSDDINRKDIVNRDNKMTLLLE